MKVIIIGAKGMLGQELAQAFKSYTPLLWDREEIDISDENSVIKNIGREKPNLVINSAAFNDVDGAEDNEALATKINGLAIRYLSAAVKANQGILVHFSTDYVFKGDNKKGYNEPDRPEPQSAYARSKYRGEQEIINSGANYYLIRLSRLFGRPAASANAKKSFVDIMLGLAKKNQVIKVVDAELSSPTYAPDLALKTEFIIKNKLPFGIYHVTNSSACTWLQFAKEIFMLSGLNIPVTPVASNFFHRKAVRPEYSILNNNKLPHSRSWQEALKDYIDGI